MNIYNLAFQIYLMLKDISDGRWEIDHIKRSLKDHLEECKKPFTKEYLLEQANSSGRKLFKIIGRVNDEGIELMEWCDEIHNFDGMCSKIEDIESCKDGRYSKRTYTLEELPKVLDNALDWYNSVRKNSRKFHNTKLHLIAVDNIENELKYTSNECN